MLINDEDPDNMQRHDSVKPVGCCFLCILIDPSLLFNMTAAPRATIRPCLCYLLFCAPRVTVPCYSLFVEMFPSPFFDWCSALHVAVMCCLFPAQEGSDQPKCPYEEKCLNGKVTLKEYTRQDCFVCIVMNAD